MTTRKRSPQDLTLSQVAEELQLGVSTVRRYVATGKLEAYRVGPRAIRVPRASLDALKRPTRQAS